MEVIGYKSTGKLPLVIQAEAAECGLACIVMILGYYGKDTDLHSVRKKALVSMHGMTLEKIVDVASFFNLSCRAVRADLDNFHQLSLPCILHWDLNHFVVLKEVRKKYILIHDPAFGEKKISLSEFSEKFTGVALELSPAQNFTTEKLTSPLKLSDFTGAIIGLRLNVTKIIFLSIFMQVLALASPLYLKVVVDDISFSQDLRLLFALALGFLLLLIIQMGTSVLREYIIIYLSNKLGLQLSSNLFIHLIKLPMDYFSKRHMGDIVSRFGSVQKVREILTTGLITAIMDASMGLLALGMMMFLNIYLMLLTLAASLIYALVRYFSYKKFNSINEKNITELANEKSHFMESVRAIQSIKLFGKENDRHGQWNNHMVNVTNGGVLISKWNVFFSSSNTLLFGIENILFVYIAAHMIIENSITLGILFAFLSYKGRFLSSVDSFIKVWMDYKLMDIHLNRLSDIILTETDKIHSEKNFSIFNISGSVEVKDLEFSYGSVEQKVFSRLNFSVSRGEMVAIVGKSGSGKSTLLKCMAGLLEPAKGKIYIDSKPISSISNYRMQIAAVLQDDVLLSGDIMQNIACFDVVFDIEKVKWAAEIACVHREIEAFPMGYFTLVGDMGSTLSGGQKQRILLARAIYRKPRILFLDESTSNLDVENEKLISAKLKRLGMTCVIIAHRPEMINSADRVIDINNICVKDA